MLGIPDDLMDFLSVVSARNHPGGPSPSALEGARSKGQRERTKNAATADVGSFS